MIKSIDIKNFILIEELNIELDKGFNILTGETGAGKSIIINAIDVALGAKANKDVIKTGKEKANIELLIDINDSFNKTQFENNGIDLDKELIVSREITPTTTRSRVNGVLVTQDFIKDIREQLIDIHTQHQNYNYVHPKTHIKLLDNFGNDNHKLLLDKYNVLYQKQQETKKQLDKALANTNATEQQIEFLKFQIQEIDDAQIEDYDEDKKLDDELALLLNAEKLKELSYSSYWSLYGADQNITDSLGSVKQNLSKLSKLDESVSEMEEELINCYETLKELANSLKNYAERQELDQERIDIIQERLDLLDKLKRKYGSSLEEVDKTFEKLSNELNSIEYSQDEVIRLEKNLKDITKELSIVAANLSESRKILSVNLSKLITQELEKLELPKVQFEINVQEITLCEYGIDKVEFLISTNVSEPLKPLAKVASGGEISRVMLAIKTIFANADKTNTVIFDEIDTGISGKASQAVADAIVSLSKHHQVISITHQPIIAAKADCHIYVAKDQEEETKVRVYNLQGENKIKAIALLASGEINEESMAFAKGLML